MIGDKQKVLIVSSKIDSPTCEPVARELDNRGYPVQYFQADSVASGDVQLTLEIDRNSGISVSYDDEVIDFATIGAAWFRRSTYLSDGNAATQMSLDIERKALQAAIWDLVPEDTWLNAPERISLAGKKISQLRIAQEIGFSIPHTIVGNNWKPIVENLTEQIICKPSYPLLYDGEKFLSLYTTIFENDPLALPMERNPFPAIWQDAIKKEREWRVTVVGEDVFDAAIYTATDAKNDWRQHQLTPGKVVFKAERFPDDEKSKCLDFLAKFGLQFGTFDFIETPEGENIFLECNANGQYRWLEDMLGLPISKSIANRLISIAEDTQI